MGIGLADFGYMTNGMQDALARAEATRNAEADRDWLLKERARRDEIEQAALEDARRQRAFQDEVRSLMPQYLAGGANAIPAQDATPGVTLDPRQTEGGDMSIPAQPAKPAQDNIAGLYKAIQAAALKNGRLSDYEAMKKRLDAYDQEGVLDFIKKARQGAPETDLIDTFNKSGNTKLASLQKVDDGVYRGVTTDGKPVEFDLDRMTESLLGPKDYLTHADRAEKTSAQLDAKRMQLDATEARNQGLDALRASQAALADARREKVLAGADSDGSVRTPGNWNVFDAQVRNHARDYTTETDPSTGKPVTDRKAALKLSSMASALARHDLTLSPAEAVEQASRKLDEMQQTAEQAQAQAETEAGTFSFSSPGAHDAWVKDRAKRLTAMRTKIADQEDNGSLAKPAPAKPAAQAKVVNGVAQPASQEEFDALPSGTKFLNPSDGKVYVKK